MRIKNFDNAWKIVKEVFGEDAQKVIEGADKDKFRMVAGKIGLDLINKIEEMEELERVKPVLTELLKLSSEGRKIDLDKKVDWEEISRLQRVSENPENSFKKRCIAMKWVTAEVAVDLIKDEWGEKNELAGGLALLLDLVDDTKSAVLEYQNWKDSLTSSAKAQSDKIGWIKEMAPNIDWENELALEETDGCLCFYKKEDKYRYMPIVAFFPGLKEEEIMKIDEILEGNLASGYKEFLRKANGVMMASIYEWWGVRRFYNEKKYLAQYHSLINSRVDEQMLSHLAKTETIIGSDKYQNLYLMDVITGEVKGLIRPNGDEMATPEKVNYASLGELLTQQVREAMKIKDY